MKTKEIKIAFTLKELEEIIEYINEYVGHDTRIISKIKDEKENLEKEIFLDKNWCTAYDLPCKYVVPNNKPCNYPERYNIDYTGCKYFGK